MTRDLIWPLTGPGDEWETRRIIPKKMWLYEGIQNVYLLSASESPWQLWEYYGWEYSGTSLHSNG